MSEANQVTPQASERSERGSFLFPTLPAAVLAFLLPASASAQWIYLPATAALSKLEMNIGGAQFKMQAPFPAGDVQLVVDPVLGPVLKPLANGGLMPPAPLGYSLTAGNPAPVLPQPMPAVDWLQVTAVVSSALAFFLLSYGLGVVVSLFRRGA